MLELGKNAVVPRRQRGGGKLVKRRAGVQVRGGDLARSSAAVVVGVGPMTDGAGDEEEAADEAQGERERPARSGPALAGAKLGEEGRRGRDERGKRGEERDE